MVLAKKLIPLRHQFDSYLARARLSRVRLAAPLTTPHLLMNGDSELKMRVLGLSLRLMAQRIAIPKLRQKIIGNLLQLVVAELAIANDDLPRL